MISSFSFFFSSVPKRLDGAWILDDLPSVGYEKKNEIKKSLTSADIRRYDTSYIPEDMAQACTSAVHGKKMKKERQIYSYSYSTPL